MSHRALGVAALLLAACTRASLSPPLVPPDDGDTPASRPYVRAVPECVDVAPAPAPARLLTRFEYDNTVRDLLQDDSRPGARFPPESKVSGFDNNALVHAASPVLVERYQAAAEELARRAVASHRDALVPCAAALLDARACGASFIEDFGRRAFRRPLTEDERAIFARLLDATAVEDGFDAAVEITIAAMLQAPQFLYRAEAVLTDESTAAPRPLDGYSIASRLSYFLWGTMPDEALFAAAAAGALGSPEGVEAQARRMLAHPFAAEAALQFFRQWLGLEAFATLRKDTLAFPGGEAQYRALWRDSLEAFLRHVFAQRGDSLGALLTEPTVYLNADMAQVYLAPASSGRDFAPVPMDATRYAGLLTQPALLALLANPRQSSPIRRGLFVRQRLLCETLPPPPAEAMFEPPEPSVDATTRERFFAHTASPSCAGCHTRIDPVGFGLEAFDELGRYRDTENGKPVDTTGALYFVRDGALAGDFSGAVELARRLAASPEVRDCVAAQWYRYALGRDEGQADRCALYDIYGAFEAAGGDFHELLVAIVTSDTFRFRAGIVGASEPATEGAP